MNTQVRVITYRDPRASSVVLATWQSEHGLSCGRRFADSLSPSYRFTLRIERSCALSPTSVSPPGHRATHGHSFRGRVGSISPEAPSPRLKMFSSSGDSSSFGECAPVDPPGASTKAFGADMGLPARDLPMGLGCAWLATSRRRTPDGARPLFGESR